VSKWTDSSSPFVYGNGVLDTTKLSNGAHTLTATAYAKGTRPASATVKVTVSNAPAPAPEPTPTPTPEPTPAPPIVLITSWNELGEGNHIIPTVGDGTSYGDAIATMLTGP